jgi:hypothetical protein
MKLILNPTKGFQLCYRPRAWHAELAGSSISVQATLNRSSAAKGLNQIPWCSDLFRNS